jgi:hypothetical protein
MDGNINLEQSEEKVNTNFQNEMIMEKLRKELSKSFADYQTTMKYMAGDAPIEVLCLQPATEKILLNSGCLRIYDIFDLDLAKIEGLGPTRLRHLTARIDQFFSMM